MKQARALIPALALLPVSLQAIEPAPCSPETHRSWAAYRQAVVKAEPGTPLYVPHPYPTSDKQVLTDFRFVYFRMFGSDAPSELPPAEAPVLAGLRANTLRLTVTRVENWSPTRCGDVERQWDFVVRVFTLDGSELGRYALGQNGLFAQASVPAPSLPPEALARWRSEFSTVAEADAHARRVYGVAVAGSKLVSVAGDGDLWCESTHPCAALSGGNRSFLMGRPVPWKAADLPLQLYELRGDRPRFSAAELRSPDARTAAMRTLDEGERLVALAGDEIWVASPVEPIAPK